MHADGGGSTARVGGGGLHTLFTMVLGGLVGATPHMVSASVMALARLLFEFAPTLAGLVPELLPAVLMLLRWRINLLSLGDLDAASLGVDVRWLRWLVIAVVSLIVAAQVSVAGVIGWVGLVVPHLARMLVGPDHRRLLPASALLGGLFVLGLDDVTRTIVRGELPVGVLSALVGTPFICFLFWKTQTKGWSDQ